MSSPSPVVFCADDFTGACDTLATLVRHGADARLYLQASNILEAGHDRQADVNGLAAPLRALSPEQAVECMREIAPRLVATGASIYHLKVCSTFDSSPQTGNIATVVDVLSSYAGASWTAIIGGQPSLKRYCLFGHLFADMGGEMFRIDRHPVMRSHPITPMDEADLRRHLHKQGWHDVGLVPYTAYADGAERLFDDIQRRLAKGEKQTLFDVSSADNLRVIGAALNQVAERQTLVCVGASSVAEALFADRMPTAPDWDAEHATVVFDGPVFAFVGSRSPVTAEQIRRASGYSVQSVSPETLNDENACSGLIAGCRRMLAGGDSVLVYLSDEPATGCDGAALSRASAEFVQAVVENIRVGCLSIAGGDTASAVVGLLHIDSLSVLTSFDRGAPLMRTHASNARLHNLPVILKGGQMGSPDFFCRLRAGVSA